MKDSPKHVKAVVRRAPSVMHVVRGPAGQSFFYRSADRTISMRWTEEHARFPQTWRHEYGHHLDEIGAGRNSRIDGFGFAKWPRTGGPKGKAINFGHTQVSNMAIEEMLEDRRLLAAGRDGRWQAMGVFEDSGEAGSGALGSWSQKVQDLALRLRVDEEVAAQRLLPEVFEGLPFDHRDIDAAIVLRCPRKFKDYVRVAEGYRHRIGDQLMAGLQGVDDIYWQSGESVEPGYWYDFLGAVTNEAPMSGLGHGKAYYGKFFRLDRGITEGNTAEAFANYVWQESAPERQRQLYRALSEQFMPGTMSKFDELFETLGKEL